jgi:hypothetical protein
MAVSWNGERGWVDLHGDEVVNELNSGRRIE